MDNTFIFTGRPGAGKGTQAHILADKIQAKLKGAGAELRKLASEDTPIARKARKEMDDGLLLPSWVPVYLFHNIVFYLEAEDKLVLDGFARKKFEAETITDTFNWIERPFTVINIEIPPELVRERVALRSATHKRGDDESVDERLNEYNEHTVPAIEYFRKHAKLIDIDGTRKVEEISEEIWNKIQ